MVQCSCSGWSTGNGKKRSNSQACCLAQLFLAAASFLSISCGPSWARALYRIWPLPVAYLYQIPLQSAYRVHTDFWLFEIGAILYYLGGYPTDALPFCQLQKNLMIFSEVSRILFPQLCTSVGIPCSTYLLILAALHVCPVQPPTSILPACACIIASTPAII